ncbi:MAG: hypothetical protein NTV48_02980 [Candidatus Vogelbacteria bacterium]|nr:hypothetical protein [Candidatus Vogelbacteria bacterium]
MQEIADKKFVAYKKAEAIQDVDFDEVALRVLAGAKKKNNIKKNK